MVRAQALAHGLNILGARLNRDLSSKQGDQFRWHYQGGSVNAMHQYLKGMGYRLIFRGANGHRLLSILLYEGDGDYVLMNTPEMGVVEVIHTNHLTPMTVTERSTRRMKLNWVRWGVAALVLLWVVVMAIPGVARRHR